MRACFLHSLPLVTSFVSVASIGFLPLPARRVVPDHASESITLTIGLCCLSFVRAEAGKEVVTSTNRFEQVNWSCSSIVFHLCALVFDALSLTDSS